MYDPIVTALNQANSQVSLCRNPYNGTVIAPATETGALAGVAPRAVTAAHYYWCQVSGPAAVLVQGTIVIGNKLMRDLATKDGAAIPEVAAGSSLGVNPTVGTVMAFAASTEYALVWLTIA